MAYFTIKSLAERHGQAYPELQEFLVQTNQGLVTSLWDVTGPFGHLCRSKLVSKLFEMEARNICADPEYDGQNQDFELDRLETPSFKLAITQQVNRLSQAHESHANEMACYAVDFLTCNLGPGILEFQIYETPDTQDNRLFDRTQKPRLVDQRCLQVGEVIGVRAGKDILRMVDDPSPDVYQMHCVSTTTSSTLVWHYDVATREPLYCTAGNQMSSRLEIAIAVLTRMAGSKALPAIRGLCDHEDHFVRWTAVRSAIALDRHGSLDILERAQTDEHPHVRAAASKMLSALALDGSSADDHTSPSRSC